MFQKLLFRVIQRYTNDSHIGIDTLLCMQSFSRVSRYASRLRIRRFQPQSIATRVHEFQHIRRYATEELDDNMGKEKDKVSYQLKVPKGTKDWEGRDMVIRDKIFGTITDVFKRHGAVTIDTLVNSLNRVALNRD